MMDKVNVILIGGAMAFAFLKAQGKNIGSSVVDDVNLQRADDIIKNQRENPAVTANALNLCDDNSIFKSDK